MGRIETFAQPEIVGMNSPTVIEAQESVGTHRPHCASERHQSARADVGEVGQRMTDEEREKAIQRAAALMEYLHALAQFHWALCNGEGDYFTHRAAYDLALSDCHAARGIMERLIKGRSKQPERSAA